MKVGDKTYWKVVAKELYYLRNLCTPNKQLLLRKAYKHRPVSTNLYTEIFGVNGAKSAAGAEFQYKHRINYSINGTTDTATCLNLGTGKLRSVALHYTPLQHAEICYRHFHMKDFISYVSGYNDNIVLPKIGNIQNVTKTLSAKI
jgi:hypothetical protein